jgi:hypothetical protein
MERTAPMWAVRRRAHPPTTPARAIRATAVLLALGALLTLADALQTQWLLQDHQLAERWGPMHFLIEQLGTDVALGLASVVAVATMAILAAGAVYARRPIANAAFVVLAVAVVVRAAGCVNNFGLILR